MGAAARKPASTSPAKAAENMSVASAFRGNAGARAEAQGTVAAKGRHGRAPGVLSDDAEQPETARSDVESRAPDVAITTPDRTAATAKRSTSTSDKIHLTPISVLESSEDMLEEFDSDIDLDDDPTTQSISILRRTGAQINLQNQQLEREVEILRKQLEELERLEQETVIRSPVRKAWHSSSAEAPKITPAQSRKTPSEAKQKTTPQHKRSITSGSIIQTPSSAKSTSSSIAERSGGDTKSARKSSALRGLNDKRRHTYYQHRSSSEPRPPKSSASTSNLNRAEPSPLKKLDMMSAIAEEMKSSPTEGTAIQLSDSSSATADDSDARAWSNTLAHKWVEVELLLRREITSDEDIMYSMAASEAGLLFMEQLDKTAKSLRCLRGTISRWILPYDASTSVADQSSVIRQVLRNTPEDLQGKLSEKHVSYLVAGANSVRKLVRVKIADDNDLEQARLALTTALEFFQRLQQYADRIGLTPYEALQENARANF